MKRPIDLFVAQFGSPRGAAQGMYLGKSGEALNKAQFGQTRGYPDIGLRK